MLQVTGSFRSRFASLMPRALVALLVVGVTGGLPQDAAAAEAAASPASKQLAAFIDEFSVPEDTGRLTDMSAASFAEELAQTRRNLARLRAIDRKALSTDEQI